VYWNAVCWRERDGGFSFAGTLEDVDTSDTTSTFESIAEQTDRTVAEVEEMFQRRHRYVRYLVQEGIADADDLFALLADLETDEAATVERLHQQRTDERGDHAASQSQRVIDDRPASGDGSERAEGIDGD
jgi:DNA-directed RNA polymerase sigma subunit (sigma70/sigma32)